jgi:hypothetical protein
MRSSDVISARAMSEIPQAANAAIYRGCRLDQFLTVHCSRGGISLFEVHVFITAFTKSVGDWLRLRGAPLAWIWVLENPPMHGLNWHFLLHVPEEHIAAFKRVYRKKLELAGANVRPARVAKLKPVRERDDPFNSKYREELEGLLRYLLKGGEPEMCQRLWIKHVNQGFIIGKRVGFSEFLGPKARAKAKPSRWHHYRHGRRVEIESRQPFLLMEEDDDPPCDWQQVRRYG